MRLHIDESLCEGHGRCWDLLPEIVDANDRGHGFLIDPSSDLPNHLEAQALDAVRACPERAITLK